MPLAVPLRESVPGLVELHVQLKVVEAPAAIGAGAGVTAPQVVVAAAVPPLSTGSTAVMFAVAVPPLVTVKVTATGCPTLTVGVAPMVAVREAGLSTVTLIWATAGLEAAPVFASDAVTVASRVSVPCVDGVQVQVKVPVDPPAIVCGVTGETAAQVPPAEPDREGTTDETTDEAPPSFRTVSVTLTGCPAVTVVGRAARVADSAAGVWTVTVAGVAGVTEIAPPETASVPLAVPVMTSVPAVLAVQFQVKVRVAPGAMEADAGVGAVQVAVAVPLVARVIEVMFAVVVPPLVSVRVAVTAWLTFTGFRLAAMVAVSAAGTWTESVTPGASTCSAAPPVTAVPATLAPSVRSPASSGVQVQVKVVEVRPAMVRGVAGDGRSQVAAPVGLTDGSTLVKLAPS